MNITPKNICYFTDSAGYGGAEQYILTLIAALDRRAWQPTLMYHDTPGVAQLIAGAQALDVILRPVPAMPEGRVGLQSLPAFVRTVRAAQPDVFHANMIYPISCKFGLMGAIAARVPGILATQHLFVDTVYTAAQRLQQRMIAAGMHACIAVSGGLANKLRQTFDYPDNKLRVIRNGVQLDKFSRAPNPALRASLTQGHERPIVLTTARLDAQKGLSYLLQAAAALPEALFVLAGDGPERTALEAQAQALGIAERVRFLGQRNDIADLLACCDIYVLPSLFEGLPVSILEAMAAGKPVIATDIPGTDEAIEHDKTGLLAQPANVESLVTCIHSLLHDAPRAQRLAAAGKAHVQRSFSSEGMLRQVGKLYEELVDEAVPDTSEAQRNRVLRRADWRFLLPQPYAHRSVCFTDGLLKQGVVAISQESHGADTYVAATCDLAVAVNPTQATLKQAWSALQPGGWCYTEWHAPLAGGVHAIKTRLAETTFEAVACYWPWPLSDQKSAAFWLPLDAPNALNYFQHSRAKARSVITRVASALRWLAWRAGVRANVVLPICAVARKPLATNPAEMPVPQSAYVLLTGGFRSINKVVRMEFAGAATVPNAVKKMSRVPESVAALIKEETTLRAVHASHTEGMGGVPQVLFAQGGEDQYALGETVLNGVPIWTALRHDNFRKLALKATDWLIALAGSAQQYERADWQQHIWQPAWEQFSQSFGPCFDAAGLDEMRAQIESLGNLSVVCEQRDFSPWNVLLDDRDELIVLDWESAELRGLPLLDLIYFLTYLVFFLERLPVYGDLDLMALRRAYRDSLNPHTFTGRIVNECLTRYAKQVGVNPAAIRPLRMLAWLIHSHSEFKHMRDAAANGQPPIEKLRQSLFVNLLLEEVNDVRSINTIGN